MSEYGWTVAHCMSLPLAQVWALYAAITARYGNKPAGPTYQDRALIAAVRAAGASSP